MNRRPLPPPNALPAQHETVPMVGHPGQVRSFFIEKNNQRSSGFFGKADKLTDRLT